jgi:predicted nucleic acid-binding protein
VILVDTSVWIDHLRSGDAALGEALTDGDVLMHPVILGELACGNLRNRTELMALWRELPAAREATHDEVLSLIERRQLMGRGIGYVDAQLLAAALLTPATVLWTRDRALARVAKELAL